MVWKHLANEKLGSPWLWTHEAKCIKAKSHPQKAKAVIQPSLLGSFIFLVYSLHKWMRWGEGPLFKPFQRCCWSDSYVGASGEADRMVWRRSPGQYEDPVYHGYRAKYGAPSMELCNGD